MSLDLWKTFCVEGSSECSSRCLLVPMLLNMDLSYALLFSVEHSLCHFHPALFCASVSFFSAVLFMF